MYTKLLRVTDISTKNHSTTNLLAERATQDYKIQHLVLRPTPNANDRNANAQFSISVKQGKGQLPTAQFPDQAIQKSIEELKQLFTGIVDQIKEQNNRIDKLAKAIEEVKITSDETIDVIGKLLDQSGKVRMFLTEKFGYSEE